VGKGGGGGAGRETADNIETSVNLKVIDLIGEGEIEGICYPALQNVYFDSTPLQNSDGTNNYNLNYFSWNTGTNDQPPIPGFNSVKTEVSVNQEVKKQVGAVTRTVVTPNLDAVVVTIAIPRLVKYKEDGGSESTSVQFYIYLRVDFGLFVRQHDVYYDRKSSAGFEVQRRIELPDSYTQFQIRVERVTNDSTSDRLNNSTNWKSYSEVIDRKFNYPNLALAVFAISSKVISGGVPTRRYKIRAIKVQLPTNATVNSDGSLTYAGSWDGSFTTPRWCADPAWCLYDLLRNDRFGVAIPEWMLDSSKWDYYSASQWCNGQVSNGRGGTEPRFLLSLKLEEEYNVYQLLSLFASVFNGIYFLSENKLALAVDSPSDPVAVLNNDKANFNYQDLALRNRYTVAIVTWSNPDLLGQPDTTVVEDRFGIAQYGYRPVEITAVGANRLTQARRYGLYFLYTNRLQSDSLTATVGQIGSRFKPGEIVYVADRNKRDVQTGRLVSVSNTGTFTLDRDVNLNSGTAYLLYCSLPNGVLESRYLDGSFGISRSVTVSSLFSTSPLPGAVWILVNPFHAALPQYRIMSVVAKQSPNYELVLVGHAPNKYADIELDMAISEPIISIPVFSNSTVNSPRNISVFVTNEASGYVVDVSWDYPLNGSAPDQFTARYLVRYQRLGSGQVVEIASTARTVELTGLSAGSYAIDVAAVDLYSRTSSYTIGPVTLVGVAVNLSSQFVNLDSSIFTPILAAI
jgi:predicted phage tail protein